ncbi:MAG: small ribosomal subunit Rsm22 family protein [Treponema sp.]|jgi:ribosomal protein RSM22 (predicted rRNA methylase)|nr:small ribosomal subunit Rsm22 family protein [Treponema sp.]
MPPFDKLLPETSELLNFVPSLIKKTFPVPKKYRSALPSQIKELSSLLTNKRGDRSLSYMGRPNYLNAYLHYFLPWNLYRLCFLLPALNLKLNPGDTITDLGSGPLTFASALWIARPDLRKFPLEINCIDRSSPALEAGSVFFSALCASTGAEGNALWKIKPIREDIDFRRQALRKEKKSNLVCAVNLLNEIYEKIPHNNAEKLKLAAANTAQLMHSMALPGSSILTVEPGVPQSGRFISLLRSAFIELERPPVSPCTHTETCPFGGSPAVSEKKRWCHFAFEAADAPKELLRLSTAAGLPKERLVLSYLLTGQIPQKNANNALRVISDAFPLPQNRFGRYGCSSAGLVLLEGEKKRIEKIRSGDLVSASDYQWTDVRDTKSGALILEVK